MGFSWWQLVRVLPIYLSLMGLFTLWGWGIGRVVPFYRKLVRAGEGGRYETIDGLRGFLALSVFVYHSYVTYFVLGGANWLQVDSPSALRLMGSTSVALFFMITSFLFWSKAIAEGPRIKTVRLYRGRFLRLAPVYVLSALMMFALLLHETGVPHAGLSRFAFESGRLLAGFGLILPGAISGVVVAKYDAMVLWTLQYEWIFYLLLPLLAMCRKPVSAALALIVYVAYQFVMRRHHPSLAFPHTEIFLFGILTAEIMHRFGKQAWTDSWLCSVLVLALVFTAPLYCQTGYELPPLCATFSVFFLIVNGCTIFGLLKTSGAKVLGLMTYSIYLLHGLVLFICRPLLHPFYDAPAPTIRYWAVISLVGLAAILFCTATYALIEEPFIQLEARLRGRRRIVETRASLGTEVVTTAP